MGDVANHLKITVITVCFNSATTLERTLNSVITQDWPNVEYIVIDGASTDGSVEILKCFKPKLAHLVSEPDEGIYDAMNKGLKYASGDIICFLNADDQYASSTVLSKVAAQMLEYGLDAVLGDVSFFRQANPERIVRRYRSDRFRPERLASGWMPAHPALFCSRALVQRVGQFKTDYRIAGDYEFIVRAFYGHEVRYRHVPEVLVKMQMGGVSTSGFGAKLRLNREVLRACRENGIRTNIIKILSKYPAKILELLRR